eukprot:TRINITY_DN4025_c0_g1_i1.p1 TRINITY_DN4025_c0_g1~~TRINITY_DN4025_c0_g1_i1.p1  ORF type:complete len:125 (+),score=20.88 TRINITY_DN4025_c0_g1_i1:48-377(+)
MATPTPTTTYIVQQNRQAVAADYCYRFCCAPCWLVDVEGCTGMTVCCWVACLLFWPLNGFCALCYEPAKPKAAGVVVATVQPGYGTAGQPGAGKQPVQQYGAGAPPPQC